MDPESKKLLEETLELTKENNQMLHKVRSIQKWSTFWSALRLLIIVGLALGSFYFLEPYLNKMLDVWNGISKTQQKLNSGSFNDLLKKVTN